MKRQPPPADNVSYPAGRTGVVRLAQGPLKRDRLVAAEFDNDDTLPELTDAWFDELIRRVDNASARLRRS